MINLDSLLQELAQERPLFHSEKDFQLALGWKLKEHFEAKGKPVKIRLEQRFKPNKSNAIFIDIVIKYKDRQIPIELKYKTTEFDIEIMDEKYELKKQNARDAGQYDFIRDVARIEDFVKTKNCQKGYVLFLTNDKSYWTRSKSVAKYDDFKIYENRVLKGSLKWKKDAQEGSTKSREKPIKLERTYKVKWEKYPKPTNEKFETEFRYLLLEIRK